MKNLVQLLEMDKKLDHIPVMLSEVLKYLSPKDGEIYIDATFGAGGYSKAILGSANCSVLAIDRDPDVVVFAEEVKKQYGDRFHFWQGNFDQILLMMRKINIEKVDGIIFDFGVSSMQLDRGERGFSFMQDAPLDMRMSKSGYSAVDFLNSASEKEIADIIYKYGGEYDARKIARKIVSIRESEKIETTTQLSLIIKKAIGMRRSHIDLSTKTFQALRIYVNDELGAIERILEEVDIILNKGARFITVSFHSLEDAMIKHYLKKFSPKRVSRSKYSKRSETVQEDMKYELLTRRAIKPSVEEVLYNIRARSAKLRAAVKI